MMKDLQASTAISERPIPFFSVRREFFFILRRFTLTECLPCCFEDVQVKIYIAGGSGQILINGMLFPLRHGSVCALHSYHAFEIASDEQSPLEAAILVTDYTLSSYLNFLDLNDPQNEAARKIFGNCPVLQMDSTQAAEYERLLSTFEEACGQGVSNPIVKAGVLGQLKTLEDICRRKQRRPFVPPLGWQMLLFITEFYTQNLTVKKVARQFDIPAVAVNRELRRITTYSFSELLSRAQVNGACAILPLKGFTQQYLANYLGFSSEKAYYTAFRKWKGMTPMEYRNLFPSEVYGYLSNGIYDLPWSIMAYVYENYLQPISIGTAAKALFIPAAQINAILRQYSGATFQEHLTRHRMRYAEALLTTTDRPIGDIAVESGFNAINTFCRIFKNAHGITASAFRETRGGNPGR